MERSAVVIPGSDTGPAPPPEARLPADTVVGNFRITGLLNESAKGTVYSSVHQLTGERVAITLLTPALVKDKAVFTALVQQLYGVNALCHPGIADIRAVGVLDGGLSFIAVEQLDGLNLRQLLQRETRLSPGLLPALFEQVCHAIDAIHAAGFVHGRLSPRSIFVLRGPPHPTVRLRGVGDACLRGAIPPVYAAPELRASDAAGPGADIYALGALLFELVTGRPPPADALVDASLVDLVDEALMRVILKAMASRAAERHATAAELHQAMRAAIPAAAPWDAVDLAPPPPAEVEATRVQSPDVEPQAEPEPAAATPARPRRPSQQVGTLAPESIEGEISEEEIETKHDAVRLMRSNDIEQHEPKDSAETEVSSIPRPEALAPDLAPSGALGELNPAELNARERKATGADVPPSGELEPGAPSAGEVEEPFAEAEEAFVEEVHTFDESAETSELAAADLPAADLPAADRPAADLPLAAEAETTTDGARQPERWIDPTSPQMKTLQGVGDTDALQEGYVEADATEGERPPEPTRPYATPDRPDPPAATEAVVVVSAEAADEPPAAAPEAPMAEQAEADDKSQITTSVFEVSNPAALDADSGYIEPDVTSPYGPGEAALASEEAVQPQPQTRIVLQPEAATRVAALDPEVIEQLARLSPEVLSELGPDGVAELTPAKLRELLGTSHRTARLTPEPIPVVGQEANPAVDKPAANEQPIPQPATLTGSSEPVLAPQPALARVKLVKKTKEELQRLKAGSVGRPEDLAKTARMVALTEAPEPEEPEDDAYASIEVVTDEER